MPIQVGKLHVYFHSLRMAVDKQVEEGMPLSPEQVNET